uniref:SOUL heme-binding protein n=2 Tax=Octactis speculum TaxID=3111310 RepID=A0A7S2G1N8_9STRA|mmetsp:Transcript_36066/g.48790  ORF Transcript_36066/g.48790 Transcript_36066/m.48790 type:complete len:141 (+) Transcript_36066:69-491(+)
MTAPVVQTPTTKIPASVNMLSGTGYDNGEMSMAFLLPACYTTLEACPKPMDERIELSEEPECLIAVATFSGWCSESVVKRHLQELVASTAKDGLSTGTDWQLAQYNPPFTLPWFRTNEIWLPIKNSEEELLQVLEKVVKK